MRIENEIRISARADEVWRHTVEISSWPRWMPTVTSVRMLDGGAIGKGSRVMVKQPMQPWTLWRVVDFKEGTGFCWETAGRLLRMKASHRVTRNGNASISRLTLVVSGVLGCLLAPVLRFPITWALDCENQALKNVSEATGRQRGDMQ